MWYRVKKNEPKYLSPLSKVHQGKLMPPNSGLHLSRISGKMHKMMALHKWIKIGLNILVF